MLKVSHLIKFVLELNPQKTPTRLSFYNYLKGLLDAESALTPNIINEYFSDSMNFPHWNANKVQLGNEIKFLIERFNDFFSHQLDINSIRFPQEMQIIEVENPDDCRAAISQYIQKKLSKGDQFKLIIEEKNIIAIILKENKSLELRLFDKKMTIREGLLEPLRRHLCLYYDAHLELSSTHEHQIEIAPYIIAKFRYQNEKVTGVILRGYVYQELQRIASSPIQEQLRLFFPIKHLEQFFIDRRTDNYYQELVEKIERTISLAQKGDKEAQQWIQLLQNQAETALEYIYQGDKLLALLLKDLKSHSTTLLKGKQETEECRIIQPIQKLDLIN